MELMSTSEEVFRINLLSILVNEQQSLKEERLIEYQVDEYGLGVVDIRNIESPEELVASIDDDECWATWTVPFDQVEDTCYLATAYYLSPVVREYWEDKLPGKVVWYIAPLDSIIEFLEGRESDKEKAAAAKK